MLATASHPFALADDADDDDETVEVIEDTPSKPDPKQPTKATSDDDDIVIDDGEDGDGKKDDGEVTIDNGPSIDDEPPPSLARTMFTGVFDTRAMLDLVWEGDGEDVFVLQNRFSLKLEYEPSPWMKVVLSGFFIHRLMVDGEGNPDVDSPLRSTIDPQLGEAYVLWRFDFGMDVTVGHRIFNWGRTDFQRPLNVLNPLDLRDGIMPTNYPKELPVWSVELAQKAGPINISLVWIPWFRPHAVDWVGTDWAVLQPAIQDLMPSPLRDVFRGVHRSRYEEVQTVFETTRDPSDDGITGADVGLRLTTNVGGVDLGLAYAFQWDRIPVIAHDDTFATALKSAVDGLPGGTADLRSSFSSEYERRHVVGADFNFTVGPLGVKGDVAFSSERTFYTQALQAIRQPSLEYALQLDFMYDFIFDVQLEFSHLVIFGLAEDIDLAIVDNHMLTVSGQVTMRLGLELMVSVLTRWVVSHGDIMLSPKFVWRLSGLASLEVGVGIFVAGEKGLETRTVGALSDNADYVYLNSVLTF